MDHKLHMIKKFRDSMAKLIFQVSQISISKRLITWDNFSRADRVEKEPGLHETEIGTEPRREFLGSLCCFGNLHLLTCVNCLFSPG